MKLKTQTRYVCQACGAQSYKWQGRCEACGAWNSLAEEVTAVKPAASKNGLVTVASSSGWANLDSADEPLTRILTGVGEMDRVCGGGLVPGSAILMGGDPGIGKSTLLLQSLCLLAHRHKVAYISGEESLAQIRLRARRLGLQQSPLMLAAANDLGEIIQMVEATEGLEVVVIDSVQTVHYAGLESAAGTVGQLRFCADILVSRAKKLGFCLILVGHVTKEGMIAGPKVLEHMVDTVLYVEGSRDHQYRMVRAVKNRFGPTDEMGIFQMTGSGMEEVANPSALFLEGRHEGVAGTSVYVGMEGTRPVLTEIQALVASTPLSMPRRAAIGWDVNRLSMLLAVLEARVGVSFANREVYLNVAGGVRVNDPAADLAVAACLMSVLANKPVPADWVIFGEIGLTAEVRPAVMAEARLKEAARLGFTTALLPARSASGITVPEGLTLKPLDSLRKMVGIIGKNEKGA
ncbi:MAG: DNA repair protein RadA [Alphaproteobacteria bacterium]